MQLGRRPHFVVGMTAFESARSRALASARALAVHARSDESSRTEQNRAEPSRALRTRFADDSSQARDGVVDRGFTRAEREAGVVQEARSATAAALPGIDVEEVARDGDHLVLQGCAEQRVTGVDRGRQVRQVSPAVEGALGLALEAHAECAQAVEHAVALATKGACGWLRLPRARARR